MRAWPPCRSRVPPRATRASIASCFLLLDPVSETQSELRGQRRVFAGALGFECEVQRKQREGEAAEVAALAQALVIESGARDRAPRANVARAEIRREHREFLGSHHVDR